MQIKGTWPASRTTGSGRTAGVGGSGGFGHYGGGAQGARWAAEQCTTARGRPNARTTAVPAGRDVRTGLLAGPGRRPGPARAEAARNARETLVWCDARVPDRLP
ncbi:hypothetical protein GCM10023336_19150 [Streptomyces similanensis]|uniref:Uncharacterized protein n=1 Tax=Streptomyces similanensis TaxID=1274988 RepID=A0ABP9K462_9ACTN